MISRLATASVLAVLAFPLNAAAPPKAAAVEVAEFETIAELVSVDRSTRVAVLRGPNGGTLTMTVPPEAQNLDRVKPGDRFRLRYVEAVAVALQKGGAASATDLQTVELAPKGGTPGGRVVSTKRATARVTAVDRAQRTIALQGPQERSMTFKVANAVRSFDEMAVGDTIEVVYTEAFALQLVPDAPR